MRELQVFCTEIRHAHNPRLVRIMLQITADEYSVAEFGNLVEFAIGFISVKGNVRYRSRNHGNTVFADWFKEVMYFGNCKRKFRIMEYCLIFRHNPVVIADRKLTGEDGIQDIRSLSSGRPERGNQYVGIKNNIHTAVPFLISSRRFSISSSLLKPSAEALLRILLRAIIALA